MQQQNTTTKNIPNKQLVNSSYNKNVLENGLVLTEKVNYSLSELLRKYYCDVHGINKNNCVDNYLVYCSCT